MSIPRLAISRPVATLMITLLAMVIGAYALMKLPIDLMPDISMPRLSISTEYEGASPEEVEELVTKPIEEAVSTVTGVTDVESSSAEGRSRVNASFAWGTDIDAAANDVRDRLDRVLAHLPEEATRPALRKFNPADFPVLIMGVASDLDPTKLRAFVEDRIADRLERVAGVAAVSVHGGNEREIHVDLNADRIKALGLPLDMVVARIQEGNVNLPAGSIRRGVLDVRIRTPGTYATLDDIRNTIVAVVNESPVRVGDIAEVTDSFKERSNFVLINGKRGVRIAINKQSGANTVEVAHGVLGEVDKINEDEPQIEITTIINSARYIEDAIASMSSSALYGGVLAVLVLFVFLRDVRSTFIVAVAIPVSIVATFLLIWAGDYTLNTMTIGGLALGVGMLVDSAIVVIENINRLRADGLSTQAAALQGSEEVTTPIIASTLTTLVVFLPLVFMGGMSGIMFKQLALVVSFALLCSLAVALSMVPMLASKLLAAGNGNGNGNGASATTAVGEGLFRSIEADYKRLLHWALDNRAVTALVCVAILTGAGLLARMIGTELMPEADEGEVRVSGEMEIGTRVEVVDEKFREIHRIVEETVPEMVSSETFVGGRPWRPGEANTGEIRISLTERDARSRSDEDIAEALGRRLGAIPGVAIRTRRGQGFFLLRMATRGMERLTVEIRGEDLETADRLGEKVEEALAGIEGITDTHRRQSSGIPEEVVVIDRQKAEQLHMSVNRIATALQTILTGARAGEFKEKGDEYQILVKVKDAKDLMLDEILDITVANALGEPVVLRNVVNVKPEKGPQLIERIDKERVVEVRANIRGRELGWVVKDVQEVLRTIPTPEKFRIEVAGDYEEQTKAFHDLLYSFVLALLLIYMVMASQFESLRDPFVVMFSVPFAAIGVVLMLFITKTTLNIQSFIGCIMLAGIVVNNAILLVDHTNLLRRRDGMPLREAIEEAGRRRLRPILMTAFTTSLALVPLALGWGEGGEAQAPMARAVIGGLLSATLITLVFVPVVYSTFEHRRADCAGDSEAN